MKKCERCHNYSSYDCSCQMFEVEDEDGELYQIYACTEEGAGLAFAKKINENGDYILMDNEMEIKIDGNKYMISAEPDVHYSVWENQ